LDKSSSSSDSSSSSSSLPENKPTSTH
jgi:hypothetical protein